MTTLCPQCGEPELLPGLCQECLFDEAPTSGATAIAALIVIVTVVAIWLGHP